MDPKEQAERRRLVAENARKQLAEKTWPQVIEVFGYQNPRIERKSDEEFIRLKGIFEKAGHPNLTAFIEIVRFEEQRFGVSMSFNLSMRRRITPGDAPPTAENAISFFSCPDILVGTRRGIESAFHWFENLSQAMNELLIEPELVQIFDKIFGEALEHLKVGGETTTLAEMLEKVTTPAYGVETKPPKKEFLN